MKVTSVAGALLLALLSTHCAYAQCVNQLVAAGNAAFVPLPPSCRAIGPVKLGMTKRELFALLGTPDNQYRDGAHNDMLVYVLPRNLNAALARHPRTRQYFDAHEVEASVRVHADRIVFIGVTGVRSSPVARYGMGVMSVGGRVAALTQILKVQPIWNNSHDTFNLFPYPIFITTMPYHGALRITGISIADSLMQSGAPGPVRISFEYVPSTHLIRKYVIHTWRPWNPK